MSILSGIRKQKKYITDANGDHTLVSEWTNTDTVDLATDIVNNERTLAEATEWDDTYDDVSTQPTGMSELVSKMTTTFNNTKYLQNQNESTKTILSELIDIAHPIGSLYWSLDPTDPGTLPGWEGTTWERIKNSFIYAMGDGDTVEGTGGKRSDTKQVTGTVASTTLDVSQIPSHNHKINQFSVNTSETGAHTHSYDYPNWYGSGTGSESSENGAGWKGCYGAFNTGSNGNHKHSVTIPEKTTTPVGGSKGHTHTFTGGNVTIDTMPPYINYYCWKRTA